MSVRQIGYFDDGEFRAGTGRYLTEIIGALDRSRFQPVFFAPRRRAWHEDFDRLDVQMVYGAVPPSPAQRLTDDRSSSIRSRRKLQFPSSVSWTLGTLKDTLKLSRLFRKVPVHLLHSNNTGAEPAPIAARLARVPKIVGTLHVLPSYDLEGVRGGIRYRLLEKASMQALDHVIACCDAARRDWDVRCGLRSNRVTVIHNGIQVDRVSRRMPVVEARGLLGLPEEAVILATIGNLHAYKGQEHLIRAMPAIVAQCPMALAVIAGTGPAECELKRLAEELRVDHKVRFLGFCSEIGTLLDSADIYVQPSLVEAFPIAILEAAAAGLAIVATAVGGVPEAIEEGVTGLLVPPRDAPALARAIGSLASCPERRRALGDGAQTRVNALFTTQKMLGKTTDLYESLLS